MAKRTQAHRQFAVATPLGEDVLLLKSIVTREELGRLFQVDLVLVSENQQIGYDELLGKNVTVRLVLADDRVRYFNGFVSRFVQTGSGGGMAEYRATLVPWLWMLTRFSDCRIFQNQKVPDIVKQIFRDHGFSDFEDKLSGTYREWEYCVQYRETDFNFISRLLEQEGIYYYFRHENGKHVLVLADSSSHHEAFEGYAEIRFRPADATMADREFINSFALEQHLQPGQFAHGDFDFTKTSPVLTATQSTMASSTVQRSEIFDYPGEFTSAGDGEGLAKIRMQELETRFESASGSSDSRGIAVGHKFKLAGYRRTDQCKDYLVTGATFHGSSDEYESGGGERGAAVTVSFNAIPASQQFRPARTSPKPVIQGPQTAIVVGKSGEEIWTDEYGRVKVMFHWDRAAKGDESSSCWIRVAQHWAGKKWGAMMIPRIGQEVIVEFLEGDPDRPIITGRVYNAVNKVPYELPGQKTVSTLKSNSSPGGGGFNEIRFEDKKGEEQVFIHGEKDLHIRVKNDCLEWFGHDRHHIVKNDKFEKIENDRHESITRDHLEEIGRDRHIKVKGKEAAEVTGSKSLKVADDVVEKFEKNQSTEVTKDLFIKADNVCIEGQTNITLKVGSSSIAIESAGIKIQTSGQAVIEATGTASVKGTGGLTLDGTSQAELKAANTTVKGDAALSLKGGMVKIN